MSKADKIINSYEPSVLSGSHVKRYGQVAIKKMMHTHTSQTLQELKAKVNELSFTELEVMRRKENEDGSFSAHREIAVVVERKDVHQLIEEIE